MINQISYSLPGLVVEKLAQNKYTILVETNVRIYYTGEKLVGSLVWIKFNNAGNIYGIDNDHF